MADVKVIYYPRVQTQSELDDILARLSWYFHPVLDQVPEVVIPVVPDLELRFVVPPSFDDEIKKYIPLTVGKINLQRGEDDPVDVLRGQTPATSLFLHWKTGGGQTAEVDEIIKKFRAKGRYYAVDPVATRMEGSFYLWAVANAFVDKDAIAKRSLARFRYMKSRLAKPDKAYVFGTGPGLSDGVRDLDFSDGTCIVANSMVLNKTMMTKLQPRIICAADPLFHSGCSKYAGEFRRTLIDAMRFTGAHFITSLRDQHIFEAYLPAGLRERVIGIPFDDKRPYNADLEKAFYINPKANVLTLLLMPVAGSIAKEVGIVGCDGRPLDQNSYFWAHDKAAQFNNQMDDIKIVHPAFFAIDYNDYYTSHCDVVEEASAALETKGVAVKNLTPSYIPGLLKRFKDPLAGAKNTSEVIIIDPDAVDHFGHYLAYDLQVGRAVAERGLKYSVIGNVKFDAASFGLPFPFEAGLRVHSWTIGNRPQGPAQSDVDMFEEDMRRIMSLRRQRGLNHPTSLYLYVGSFEHAQVIDTLLREFPEYDATVNLFYTPFVNYLEPAYVERWRDFIDASVDRLVLTAPTKQFAVRFERAYDVRLPSAPHPSTTFDDSQARKLPPAPKREAGKPARVVFPGGMRLEKGYGTSVTAAVGLKAELGDKVDLCVRSLVRPSTPKPLLTAHQKLIDAGVPVNGDDMDEHAFAKFMADADVIVLPYKAEAFAERTSGLTIDALLLGRPCVVCEGTWLADVARDYGTGIAVKDNAEAFIEGVKKLLAEGSKLDATLKRAKTTYLENNSWLKLVDSITSGVANQTVMRSVAPWPAPRTKLTMASKPAPAKPAAEPAKAAAKPAAPAPATAAKPAAAVAAPAPAKKEKGALEHRTLLTADKKIRKGDTLTARAVLDDEQYIALCGSDVSLFLVSLRTDPPLVILNHETEGAWSVYQHIEAPLRYGREIDISLTVEDDEIAVKIDKREIARYDLPQKVAGGFHSVVGRGDWSDVRISHRA